MSDDIIIDVKNVWKRYGLPPLLPWKRHALREEDCALKDISFQVRRGGSLGILGRNGAGKSTLLKLLAGVTPPDKGSIDIRGSIFPMIELNAGISMELSGIENIQLLATIMGFNDKAIRRLEPEVVDFSELEGWIDKPVWQYSSGMLARLAFGIAVHARADILLVDEVLSTGDIMFQKKCHLKIQEMLQQHVTLLFVTHSPYQMERICENAIILKHGRIDLYGNSSLVMQTYISRSIGEETTKFSQFELSDISRPGTGDLRIIRAYIDKENVAYGDNFCILFEYFAKEDIGNVSIVIKIKNNLAVPITNLHLMSKDAPLSVKKGYGTIKCHISQFKLTCKIVYIDIRIASTKGYDLDRVQDVLVLNIDVPPHIECRIGSESMVYLDCHFSHEGSLSA